MKSSAVAVVCTVCDRWVSVSRITLACDQQMVSNRHESLQISKCNTACQKLKILRRRVGVDKVEDGCGKTTFAESDSLWYLSVACGLMRPSDSFLVLVNIWNEALEERQQKHSVIVATKSSHRRWFRAITIFETRSVSILLWVRRPSHHDIIVSD